MSNTEEKIKIKACPKIGSAIRYKYNLVWGVDLTNHEEYQNEMRRDDARSFFAEQYISSGYYLHFHRNMEIYGVVSGKVCVTIAGQQRILESGQMAVIDGLENHSYEINGRAEVFFFHIGTTYVSSLYSLYPKKRLPYWLTDIQYNQRLYGQIKPMIDSLEPIPELKRIGIACHLFSDIIEHYGLVDKVGNVSTGSSLVTQVVQYVYDHYSEHITLDVLSKKFYISPKALSKKIKKHLNVDFRVFVNDIRVQRAIQMRDDPKNQGKPLSEIAAACGFTNMGTFYRSYERNFKYRKLDKES